MGFETPIVSVIIPLYNSEEYIEKAIYSLSLQTFNDMEIIIIDDCSTDKSFEIVRQIKEQTEIGKKIKIIKLNTNKGVSNARNIGLRMSRGKYVTFMDNDDMLVPNALEIFVNLAESNKAEVIHTHSHYENRDINNNVTENTYVASSFERGNKKRLKDPAYYLTNDMKERMTEFSNFCIDWNVWGKLFNRDFLMMNNIQFPKIHFTEDLLFVFQCLMHAKKYILVPEVLYIYRYRNDSTLRGEARDKKFLKNMIGVQIEGTKLMNEFMEKIKYFQENPGDKLIALQFYMNLEMMSTRLMHQRLSNDETYFETLIEIYKEHFGADATFLALMHKEANYIITEAKEQIR